MVSDCTDIIIDWLSFTCQSLAPQQLIARLGLADMPWIALHGTNGYQDRFAFLNISVHFNGRPGMGTWCEMTGQGCRAFEDLSNLDWNTLFRWLTSDRSIHVTRLDVACDDRIGVLPMKSIVKDIERGNYISKMKKREIVRSGSDERLQGTTVTLGSPQSQVRIRLYDKAAEQEKPEQHWIRCEMQLRDDRAHSFMARSMSTTIGHTYTGVLSNYLKILRPIKEDSNKSRWPMRRYWRRFINNAERISIFSQAEAIYTAEQCRNYVYNIAGNAIAAAIELDGVDGFLYRIAHREIRPNPKYEQMLYNHTARKAAISGSGGGSS